MKVLITGATGLVGTRLIEKLLDRGYSDINILSRSPEKTKNSFPYPVEVFGWNPAKGELDKKALEGVHTIFNLAGENIADGRWSEAKKKRILNSRTEGPKLLLSAIKKQAEKPKKLISASAVGIYGNTGDKAIEAKSALGNDFLAEVCKQWEDAIFDHDIPELKSYALRTGVVLSTRGGALAKMLPAFMAGVAGKIGSGKQVMSWIHLDDLVDQYIWLMESEPKKSIYHGCAPVPVNNIEFTNALGKAIKRPTLFPIPGFVLKVLFGEMSTVLLDGQRVIPTDIIEEGFNFQFKTIEDGLDNALEHYLKGETELIKYQWIDRDKDEVFSFFSQAGNLEKITPDDMKFQMTQMNTPTIQKGSLIDYSLKVHGLPMKWKTEIKDYVEGSFFIDDQLKGPYSKWLHRHDFIAAKSGGCIIKDHIIYKLPLGLLGSVVAGSFVKKDVNHIFNYRKKVIQKKLTLA